MLIGRVVRRRDTGVRLAGFVSERLRQAVEIAGPKGEVLAYLEDYRWFPCSAEEGERLRARGTRVESVYLTLTDNPNPLEPASGGAQPAPRAPRES